jgi:two-component system sensor histidine kinase BarA
MDDQPVASLIEEPLDAAALLSFAESMRLAKHNSALAADLLQMLLDSLPEGAAEIERLTRAENWSELQNFAHKFYGGCCYVGVPALQLASRTLDRYLQGGATADVPALVAQLKTQMQALLAWSENYDVASLFAD